MIYVTSDLHGYSLENFKGFLNKVGFCDEDILYILGDVIDRGPDGVKILKWLMLQPNVELLLGNHEAMLLACDFLFDEITEESISKLTGKNEINAGVGSLNINLQGEKESYKIQVDKGLGSIKIDGKEISDEEVFGDGENYIEVDGGVGNIKIDFAV